MIFTDTTISGSHLSPDATNSNQEGYVWDRALSAVPANIQPLDPYQTDQFGGAYSSTYKMFVPTSCSGIVESDRIMDNTTGKFYIVKGKNNFTINLGSHLEYMIDEELY